LMFAGDGGAPRAAARRAGELLARLGGRSLGEAPGRAWYERRYAVSYEQSRIYRHGAFNDTFEVAAPWSRLEALYENVRSAIGRRALVMAHLSHAYPDGCSIYFTFIAAARGARSTELHEAIWREGLDAALASGGSMTHHHGVGRLRRDGLARELGPGGVWALARVKRAWDPQRILCPGSPLGAELEASESGGARAERAAHELDVVSGLVRIAGSARLRDVERALERDGFTLGLDPLPDLELAEFLGAGLPGARDRWADPVEQSVAGFSAVLSGGRRVELSPAPRRAAGPDLTALFVGAGGRIGRVEHAWLRAHAREAPRSRSLAFQGERDPALSSGEASAWEALVRSFTPPS
jgi:alkyldihydroxyacetonephosphate synthase